MGGSGYQWADCFICSATLRTLCSFVQKEKPCGQNTYRAFVCYWDKDASQSCYYTSSIYDQTCKVFLVIYITNYTVK